MSKLIEFIGTSSGDGDGFVFNVDMETFKRITGRNPEVYDEARYPTKDKNLDPLFDFMEYMLYPDAVIRASTGRQRFGGKIKFSMKCEVMEEE